MLFFSYRTHADSIDLQIGMTTNTADTITVNFGGVSVSSLPMLPPGPIDFQIGITTSPSVNLFKQDVKKLDAALTALSDSRLKLSQGLLVTSAADDATSLGDSERLKNAIRGVDQASKSCADTVSLLQSAEGGLAETSGIIERLRNLIVQASSTTFVTEKIKTEVKQLDKEAQALDRKIVGGNAEQKKLDQAAQKLAKDVHAVATKFFGVGMTARDRRMSTKAAKEMMDVNKQSLKNVSNGFDKTASRVLKQVNTAQRNGEQAYKTIARRLEKPRVQVTPTPAPIVPDLAPLTTPTESIKDIINISFTINDSELQKRQVNGISIALDQQTHRLENFSHGGVNVNNRGLAVGDWVCILPSPTLWRCQGRDVLEVSKEQTITMYFSKFIDSAPSQMTFNLLHDDQMVGTFTMPRQTGAALSADGTPTNIGSLGGGGGGFTFSR